MTHGHYYRNEGASSIYIDVLRTLPIKAGVWLVKCRVMAVYGDHHYETTSFRLTAEGKKRWQLYVPQSKRGI